MSRLRSIALGPAGTFLVVASVLTAYAVDGGAYDLVVRQQWGLAIWWILFLAAAFGLLPAARPAAPLAIALAALAALAAWTAISFSWSQSDERTLIELARTLHHLGLLLLVVIIGGRERWVAAVGGATAAAALVCGLALASRLAPGTFGEDLVAGAFDTNRLSVPLDYWNAVGAWAAMAFLLLLAWSAHARTGIVRACALAAAPMTLAVLYLTYSRASIGDLAVGFVVLIAVSARRWTALAHGLAALGLGLVVVLTVRAHPEIADATGTAGAGAVLGTTLLCGAAAAVVALVTLRAGLDRARLSRTATRRALAGGGVVLVVLLALVSVTVAPKAWDDFRRPSGATGSDPAARLTNLNGGRYQIWASSIATFRAHPLRGTGAGTFEFTWNQDGRNGEFLRDAHSLYAEPLGELGLPGGLLVLLFVGAGIALIVLARRRATDERAAGAIAGIAAAGGAYLFAAGVDWMWEATAVTALFLVLLGSAGAATMRPAPALRWPARAVLALAALVAALVMVPQLVATSQVRSSQRAAASGDLGSALADARSARAAAPWAATPWFQIGLVEEQKGDLEAARAALLAARAREPTNWRIPFILSRVEAQDGDASAALRAYRDARRLRPRGAVFPTGS